MKNMKNIAILALFLVSMTGYGQISTRQGDFILTDNKVERPTDELSEALWIGRCDGAYETPYGVFISTREWVVVNQSYKVVTYRYLNDTLNKVDALDGYIVYDYSPSNDLFLVRQIEKSLDIGVQRSIMGNDVYTYSFNNNKFKLQLESNRNSNFKVNLVKFIDDYRIQYLHYNSTAFQTQTIK